MASLKGREYLARKLAGKQTSCSLRYRYYEMHNGIDIKDSPLTSSYDWAKPCLGWCAKAVDSLADRLDFRGFDNDSFDINGIYELNNPDVLYDSAMLSALITSCSFIYISQGDDGFPRMQVIDGRHATGIIDPITNMLTEGYAELEHSDTGQVTRSAYFTPDSTVIYDRGQDYIIPNPAPYALLVPVIYRPDPKRPFGHARITRACMAIVQSALRTIRRSEVSAEFYSFPQKYVLGLDQNAEMLDRQKATISSFLQFTKDEDGDRPTVGQFQQQSMAPYNEQMRMFAGLFAAETGLTLDDLGFPTENPSSVEAIKAQHENLRLAARKAQKTFSTGFLNAGYLAACLRDDFPYRRDMIYKSVPKWRPIFEPDAATLSLIGDGAIKVNQAVPGYFGKDNLEDMVGQSASSDSSAQAFNFDDLAEEEET